MGSKNEKMDTGMTSYKTALVKYETPLESVRKAVALSSGLDHMPSGARVFIKPNIVFWTKETPFPKWGVITTSRLVHDITVLLKERGVEDITIGEGSVTFNPRDRETQAHAYESLGYGFLKKRYGVKSVNVFDRPFKKVDLGDGMTLRFNADILESDFVVNLPVMKTHNQTRVSLGIKNLKGVIDISSRKKCHNADPRHDLHAMVARLADPMPPMLTLVDGIYTNERGPGMDGRMRRSDILAASADVLSADMTASKVLGHDPRDVPHLAHAAAGRGRPADMSDVEVVGEKIEDVADYHEFDFGYSENERACLPVPMAREGISGVFYQKYDLTMCTYCSGINGLILSAIRYAWKGEPWDDVEVLTGKTMTPSPGKKKTILVGECMHKANADHPHINERISIRGCPPQIMDIHKALNQAGIQADAGLFENFDKLPGFFMEKYAGRPEFDEGFFRIE
ncbi:conserved hypothetical protein [Candidatus Desulfarcum epimagneticum]|uniref:DUF362 domain-containing protein n=1 Tax=uncultured Desulfobacteraceae bacterium TaxID=218296 RepID=A0A484HJ35_9BACT|nr:conserved hypothetical protein [uncultured Desulfobacteraceae bacterium]